MDFVIIFLCFIKIIGNYLSDIFSSLGVSFPLKVGSVVFLLKETTFGVGDLVAESLASAVPESLFQGRELLFVGAEKRGPGVTGKGPAHVVVLEDPLSFELDDPLLSFGESGGAVHVTVIRFENPHMSGSGGVGLVLHVVYIF